MPINPCNTACNPYLHLRLAGACDTDVRSLTIKYLVAIRCSHTLATNVFANADGAAGDTAFLTLLNNALFSGDNAIALLVADYEFPDPESTDVKTSVCKMPRVKKHSQQPTFTVTTAFDLGNTIGGISQANREIGWHQIGALYDLENQTMAVLQEQSHVYLAITCDGKVYWMGRGTNDTPLAMDALVEPKDNTDNFMDRYVENVITLRSPVWIRNPKYWTPRAVINGVTNAGLTTLNQYINI